MYGAVNEEKSGQENCEYEVIEIDVVVKIDHAEQLATRHALQSVLTTCKRHLHPHKVQHLRQRQSNHGKVNACAAYGEAAEEITQQARKRGTREDAQLRRQPPYFHRVPCGITCGAQKRCVAKRQQTGVAQQQVEGAGKQGEAPALHQNRRVYAKQGCDCAQHDQRDETPVRASHYFSRPNKPAGRTSNTMDMMTNTTTADASG